MRAVVTGTVVEIRDASYDRSGDGAHVVMYDVFVRQDGSSLAYGADRLSVPGDHMTNVVEGEAVSLLVSFTAKTSKAGNPYLSAFVVGRPDLAAERPSLAAVES